MAFINEYISARDFSKYNFDVLNNRPKKTNGTAPSDAWTIDRESNIWLRQFYLETSKSASVVALTGVSFWDFFWRKELMQVKLLSIDFGGNADKHCWARKRLLEIEMPCSLVICQAQAIRDLGSALNAYKDGGVRSEAKTFSLVLE
ncbi:hypothetical protein [Hydrogenophaga sp.]|uniref:hypothetical protein n=1 Tax=Hydrogenophaga sp. TaxID=1904254 RepID=UPI002717F6CD|nr:hypothetical protein [Hydrogenophaga sp.]MDO9437979.1 hypothetical protein [Hydrogenophaga sp.]